MRAASSNHSAVVDVLLQAGADVHMQSRVRIPPNISVYTTTTATITTTITTTATTTTTTNYTIFTYICFTYYTYCIQRKETAIMLAKDTNIKRKIEEYGNIRLYYYIIYYCMYMYTSM